MRIGIIGSGALGLFYGALLQRSDHDVHFLLRRDYQAITSSGLKVFSPRGDFHLQHVQGYRNSEQIGPVDLVLIGLKAHANEALIELVRPLVAANTTILTLQNGLGNEDLLATAFAPEQILGGVAFLCCNRGEPGKVHHLDQGAIRIANFAKSTNPNSSALAETFNRAGIPCEVCPDLLRIRWEKLVWNIPFNGLCALTGLATDRLLACPETLQLVEAMMLEVIAAANRQELTERLDDAIIGRLFSATSGMGAYRPSMMIDRQQRSPLELKAIYGIPLERAASKDTPMPRVAMLHALLAATE